jgi:DNA-binding MarR family transcriptional regulator
MNTKPIDPAQLKEIGRVCPVANVRKASRKLTQIFDDLFRPIGLLSTQYTVMVHLGALQETTITLLAQVLGMDRTTVTRELEPLIRDGYVVTYQGEDRRVRKIHLTEAGYGKLTEAIPLWEAGRQAVTRQMGEANWQLFMSGLARLDSNPVT